MLVDSNRISPVLLYSRCGQRRSTNLRVRDFYPLWSCVPATFYSAVVIDRRDSCTSRVHVVLPLSCNDARLGTREVWAVPFSLATTQGMGIIGYHSRACVRMRRMILMCVFFLFLGLLRCFSSPGITSHRPCSLRIMRHDSHGVSPFGDLRIAGCSAPPRSVSPLAASFVVVCSQGIHHTLFWRIFFHDPASVKRRSRNLSLAVHNPLSRWQRIVHWQYFS